MPAFLFEPVLTVAFPQNLVNITGLERIKARVLRLPIAVTQDMFRPIFLEIESPFLLAPFVVLYRDSWELKIGKRSDFQSDWIIETVKDPAFVVRGTTNTAHLAFVSRRHSSKNGSPLVVFVSEIDYPCPIVSVSFRRDFRDLRGHDILWP